MHIPSGSVYDVNVFFESDFAEDAEYTPSGGAGVDIKVVFDEAYQATTIGKDLAYSNANPSVLCKSVDVETATEGDTLIIADVTYYVIAVEPEGTGITRLVLSKDAP
jgi:hypothetical protein